MPQSDTIRYEKLILDAAHRTAETTLSPETACFTEVVMITSGNGLCRVPDLEIPCKEGDVLAFLPPIKPCFTTEGTMTVRRILFDPAIWLEGDAALPACDLKAKALVIAL